ncbi:MAG: hypothetical protein GY769_04460 [bacterium]|nr:hypothetical protein [bacterium]
MPQDHIEERKLRVILLEKHPPYNKGEERGLPESQARRLCVTGTAMPAPKNPRGIKIRDAETGELVSVEDTLGGWKLSRDEEDAAASFRRARKISAGDMTGEMDAQRAATAHEEERVEAEAEKSDAKTGDKFLKGGKKDAASKTEAKK